MFNQSSDTTYLSKSHSASATRVNDIEQLVRTVVLLICELLAVIVRQVQFYRFHRLPLRIWSVINCFILVCLRRLTVLPPDTRGVLLFLAIYA